MIVLTSNQQDKHTAQNDAVGSLEPEAFATTSPSRNWLGRFRRSPNAVLVVACLAIFTDMLIYGAVIPLVKDLLVRVGVSKESEVLAGTTLFAIYAVGLFVATPVFGIVSDRLSNRQVPMLLGLLGLAATTMLFTFADSFALLMVARVFQGVSAAASWVVGMAMVADAFPVNRLGFAMGIVFSFNTLGSLLGPLMGGILSAKFSIETPFYVCSVLAALDFIARCLIVPPKPLSARPSLSAAASSSEIAPLADQKPSLPPRTLLQRIRQISFSVLLSHTEIMLLAIIAIIASASFSTIESLVSIYLTEKFQVTVEQTTASVCAFIVPSIVCSIVIGLVSDRIPRTRILMVGGILHAAASPILALATNMWQFNLGAVYFGITSSLLLTPAMPEMASRVTHLGYTSSYARTYAIYNICYSLGMLVGPFGAAVLASEYSFFAAMLIVPVAMALFLPFYILYTLKMERKRTGLDASWSAVFRSFPKDLINLKRDAPLATPRADLVQVVTLDAGAKPIFAEPDTKMPLPLDDALPLQHAQGLPVDDSAHLIQKSAPLSPVIS